MPSEVDVLSEFIWPVLSYQDPKQNPKVPFVDVYPHCVASTETTSTEQVPILLRAFALFPVDVFGD